ncbi:MAG: acyltransferase family protein [Chitinophagales bacterium]
MHATKNNIHFPALDGLRAIAAFVVLWTHIERFKQLRSEPTLFTNAFNSFLGGLAVTFFFVLSGFLITWLLTTEKQESGNINSSRFLKKRFLRIAPLYYLVLILGYLFSIFIFHDTLSDPFANGFIMNLLLLPNIAFAFGLIPEILIQIWSIGTEVQFYLLWPFVIKKTRTNILIPVLVLIILSWNTARVFLWFLGENKSSLAVIIFRTRIDCMAIGGLFALSLNSQFENHFALKKLILFVRRNGSGWLLAILFSILIWLSWHYNLGWSPLYAFLFACIIIRLVHRPSKILDSNSLNFLGKISYGIYLLHHFAVYLVFWGFSNSLGNNSWNELFYFVAAGLVSVLLASASYHFYEKKFLAMKARIPQ